MAYASVGELHQDLEANGFDKRWYVSCKVYDNDVNLLLDSGASVCFPDYDVYLAIASAKRPKLDETFCDVGMVNGEKIRCEMLFNFNGVEVSHNVLVGHLAECEGPLGIDFLSRYRCNLDCSRGFLEIKQKLVALSHRPLFEEVVVRISETLPEPLQNLLDDMKDLTAEQQQQVQWNSVNKSTSGQPVLDLIRGGFNKRCFLKCPRRFRSKQIGCNKRLDLLTVDLLTEFHCTWCFA